jgi:hypothetical protein
MAEAPAARRPEVKRAPVQGVRREAVPEAREADNKPPERKPVRGNPAKPKRAPRPAPEPRVNKAREADNKPPERRPAQGNPAKPRRAPRPAPPRNLKVSSPGSFTASAPSSAGRRKSADSFHG